MSLLTNWGYLIDQNVTELPEMLSQSTFGNMTAGKYSGDVRIPSMISAAQAAIRNYCGWHVYPSLPCIFEADSVSTGRVIQLPARFVSSVESVTFNGEELPPESYHLKNNGLLYFNRKFFGCSWGDIIVKYTAGVPDELMDAIKELIAHRVTHALAQSYGVQSEAAGGVSVTYNATWTNNARATALPSDNKEVLAPYRLQGVF